MIQKWWIGKYIDPEVDRTFQWLLREKKDWEAAMASNEEKREQRWKYTYGVNKCSANLMGNDMELKLLHYHNRYTKIEAEFLVRALELLLKIPPL